MALTFASYPEFRAGPDTLVRYSGPALNATSLNRANTGQRFPHSRPLGKVRGSKLYTFGQGTNTNAEGIYQFREWDISGTTPSRSLDLSGSLTASGEQIDLVVSELAEANVAFALFRRKDGCQVHEVHKITQNEGSDMQVNVLPLSISGEVHQIHRTMGQFMIPVATQALDSENQPTSHLSDMQQYQIQEPFGDSIMLQWFTTSLPVPQDFSGATPITSIPNSIGGVFELRIGSAQQGWNTETVRSIPTFIYSGIGYTSLIPLDTILGNTQTHPDLSWNTQVTRVQDFMQCNPITGMIYALIDRKLPGGSIEGQLIKFRVFGTTPSLVSTSKAILTQNAGITIPIQDVSGFPAWDLRLSAHSQVDSTTNQAQFYGNSSSAGVMMIDLDTMTPIGYSPTRVDLSGTNLGTQPIVQLDRKDASTSRMTQLHAVAATTLQAETFALTKNFKEIPTIMRRTNLSQQVPHAMTIDGKAGVGWMIISNSSNASIRVVRIQLSTMAVTQSLTIPSTHGNLQKAWVDAARKVGYVLTDANPTKIVIIDLTKMTISGVVTDTLAIPTGVSAFDAGIPQVVQNADQVESTITRYTITARSIVKANYSAAANQIQNNVNDISAADLSTGKLGFITGMAIDAANKFIQVVGTANQGDLADGNRYPKRVDVSGILQQVVTTAQGVPDTSGVMWDDGLEQQVEAQGVKVSKYDGDISHDPFTGTLPTNQDCMARLSLGPTGLTFSASRVWPTSNFLGSTTAVSSSIVDSKTGSLQWGRIGGVITKWDIRKTGPTFQMNQVGEATITETSGPESTIVSMEIDTRWGRLYCITQDSTLIEVDPATMTVVKRLDTFKEFSGPVKCDSIDTTFNMIYQGVQEAQKGGNAALIRLRPANYSFVPIDSTNLFMNFAQVPDFTLTDAKAKATIQITNSTLPTNPMMTLVSTGTNTRVVNRDKVSINLNGAPVVRCVTDGNGTLYSIGGQDPIDNTTVSLHTQNLLTGVQTRISLPVRLQGEPTALLLDTKMGVLQVATSQNPSVELFRGIARFNLKTNTPMDKQVFPSNYAQGNVTSMWSDGKTFLYHTNTNTGMINRMSLV